MVEAQIPAPSNLELGGWLVGLAAVMAIIFLGVSLYEKLKKLTARRERPPERRYVTKKELDEFRVEVRQDIESLSNVTRTLATKEEFHRIEKLVADLQVYARDRFHELAQNVNNAVLELKKIQLELNKDLAKSLEPIVNKLDQNTVICAQLAARLESQEKHIKES